MRRMALCQKMIPLLLAPILAALGCQSATGSVSGVPLSLVLHGNAFCVEHQSKDSRNLGTKVAESLRAAGLQAKVAKFGECQDESTYRIIYVDNWSWDFRTFIAKLTIQVIDLSNDEIVAYGESYQSSESAMGMTHRGVIDRAVDALLGREGNSSCEVGFLRC